MLRAADTPRTAGRVPMVLMRVRSLLSALSPFSSNPCNGASFGAVAASSRQCVEPVRMPDPATVQERIPTLDRAHRTPKDPQRAMRLLVEEMAHRVSVEVALAIRIISAAATIADSDNTKTMLMAVQQQFESLARVHRTLQPPEARTRLDGQDHLRQLCEALSLSRRPDCVVSLESPQRRLEIDSEQCWRLGMIVFGLVTHAARGARVRPPTRICVKAARRGSLIRCEVRDNGAAPQEECEERSLRLVSALARELHGEVARSPWDEGCTTIVTFPATCFVDGEFSSAGHVP